jgi:hypothetical protein
MDTLEIRRSKGSAVTGAMFAIGLIAFAMVLGFKGMVIGSMLLILCAIALAVVSLGGYRDRQPVLLLNQYGIIFNKCEGSSIPWSDIESVRIEAMTKAGSWIVIRLKQDALFSRGECHQLMVRQRDNHTEVITTGEGLELSAGALAAKLIEHIDR